MDNFNLTPFFLRMSTLKRDAAKCLILLDFGGLSYWLGRLHSDGGGSIERRRWRWQGWAWAMPPGSVICIQLPTQIRKNAFLTYSLHHRCNKINNLATPPTQPLTPTSPKLLILLTTTTTPPVLSTMSNNVYNEQHKCVR